MFFIFSSFLALSSLKYQNVDIIPLGILEILCDPKEYLIFHNPNSFVGSSSNGDFLGDSQYTSLYFLDKKIVDIENRMYDWGTLSFTDLVVDEKCEKIMIYQNTDDFELDLTEINYSISNMACFFFTGAMTYDINISLSDFDSSYSISINNTFLEDHNNNYSFIDQNQVELRVYSPQNNESIKGSAKVHLKKNRDLKYTGTLVSGYLNYTHILNIQDTGGMPPAAIFGIVCGTILAIAMLIAILKITCCPSGRRRRSNNNNIASMQSIPDANQVQQPLNPNNNDPNNQYWRENNDQSPYTNEDNAANNPYEMPVYPEQPEASQAPSNRHEMSDPMLQNGQEVSPYTT